MGCEVVMRKHMHRDIEERDLDQRQIGSRAEIKGQGDGLSVERAEVFERYLHK
jgi:hypothetical protein